MKLGRDEVKHIALLARLGLTEEDTTRFQEQLSHILDSFLMLQQIDTTDVPPTAHSVSLQNVMREDEPRPSLPPAEVLANAPDRDGDYVKVRAVFE